MDDSKTKMSAPLLLKQANKQVQPLTSTLVEYNLQRKENHYVQFTCVILERSWYIVAKIQEVDKWSVNHSVTWRIWGCLAWRRGMCVSMCVLGGGERYCLKLLILNNSWKQLRQQVKFQRKLFYYDNTSEIMSKV